MPLLPLFIETQNLKKIGQTFCHFFRAYPSWMALFLGLMGALGLAPVHFWFFTMLSLVGFYNLIEPLPYRAVRQSLRLGWLYGLGYFVGGLYWLAHAVYVAGMWYMIPIAAVGLPAGLAIFSAMAVVLTTAVSAPHTRGRLWVFIAFWLIMEYARGHILTGFPWNLTGHIWSGSLLQVTSVIGIYGLSALTVIAFLIVFTRQYTLILATWMSFFLLGVMGDKRLEQPTEFTPAHLRLIQANISQDIKWDPAYFWSHVQQHVALSNHPTKTPLTAVIWPESSIPTFVGDNADLLEYISRATPSGGLLIIGAPRAAQHKTKDRPPIWHTSALVMNDKGQIIDFYDKAHLVPFGEYFPFRKWINLPKITYGTVDYTAGTGIRTLSPPGIPPFSALICYEAIFPHQVTQPDKRPDWLLNLTNDAWYGKTSGPFQHLAIVRIRAIEEGLPLVRSANTGISAVFDAYGRLLAHLDLEKVGVLDCQLPKPIATPPLYAVYGDLFFGLILLGLFFLRASEKFLKRASRTTARDEKPESNSL